MPSLRSALRFALRSVPALVLVLVSFAIGLPRARAQDRPPVTFDEEQRGNTYGIASTELALIGTSATVLAIDGSIDEEGPLAISIDVALSLAVIATPVIFGNLASAYGWPADIPAAIFAFLHGGFGGFAVGCAIAAPPIVDRNWDFASFGDCSREPLPWILAALVGAGTTAYSIARGDALLRTPGNTTPGALATYGTALSPVASLLALVSVAGLTMSFQALATGTNLTDPDNQLFPSGRGYMLTLGITQLVLVAASFVSAELSR